MRDPICSRESKRYPAAFGASPPLRPETRRTLSFHRFFPTSSRPPGSLSIDSRVISRRLATRDPNLFGRKQDGVETPRFRQDGYVRLFPLAESSIVVVAEGSGGDPFGEHQVDEFVLRIGKNVTDFSRRNIGLDSAFLRKFKSQPRKKILREKMTEVEPGSSKAMIFPRRSSRRLISRCSCENQSVIVRHASFPTPEE